MDWTGKIDELLGGVLDDLATVEVVIRGQRLTVRPCTVAQLDTLSRLFPEPVAPMTRDPSRGSKAPMVRNREDPAYLARCDEAQAMLGYSRLILATSSQPVVLPDGSLNPAVATENAQAVAHLKKAAAAMGRLTQAEIAELSHAHERAAAATSGRLMDQDEETGPSPTAA